MQRCAELGLTLFVFLDHNLRSCTTTLSVLHSLIFQITDASDDLQAVVCNSSQKNLKTSLGDAIEIFRTLLTCVQPVYIVVDGLDEIDEFHRGKIADELAKLLNGECKEVKIFISSRPEADLGQKLDSVATSIRVDSNNYSGIETFVNQWADDWVQNRQVLSLVRSDLQKYFTSLASKSKDRLLFSTRKLKVFMN